MNNLILIGLIGNSHFITNINHKNYLNKQFESNNLIYRKFDVEKIEKQQLIFNSLIGIYGYNLYQTKKYPNVYLTKIINNIKQGKINIDVKDLCKIGIVGRTMSTPFIIFGTFLATMFINAISNE